MFVPWELIQFPLINHHPLKMAGRGWRPKRLSESQTECDTGFERDRSNVSLTERSTGATIMEMRDEDVQQAVDDGFLNPRDYCGSAYEYAVHLGLILQ